MKLDQACVQHPMIAYSVLGLSCTMLTFQFVLFLLNWKSLKTAFEQMPENTTSKCIETFLHVFPKMSSGTYVLQKAIHK